MIPQRRKELKEAIDTIVKKKPGHDMALREVLTALNIYLILDDEPEPYKGHARQEWPELNLDYSKLDKPTP